MEYNGIHIVEGDGLVSGDSAGYIEYLTGTTLFTSQGVDATTRGAFKFTIAEDDGGNVIDSLELDITGNVVVGSAALATTATDGFLYITTCPGVPTGVPTTHTGRNPIVYDTTNDDFYVYEGGAWATVGGGVAIPDLSDVTITSSAANELLFTTGANTWVNYTLAEAGIQPLDTDLTNIAALTGTSGFLKTDGATVWSVDTATYLTGITGENIGDLTDVTITALGVDELMFTQDGSTWINQTLAEAGISATGHTHAVPDLSDVTITSSAANELLFTTGANTWVNYTLAEAGIEPADADILKADVSDVLTAGFSCTKSTLTDAATVTPTLTLSNAYNWAGYAGNRTLGFPTVPATGGVWYIDITIDATGGYTLTLAAGHNLVSGTFNGAALKVNRVWLVARTTAILDVYIENIT